MRTKSEARFGFAAGRFGVRVLFGLSLAVATLLGPSTARAAIWPDSWTKGQKTLLYIRVDFANNPGEPVSVADAQAAMNQVDAFVRKSSYGQTSVATTVTPLLRVPNFGIGNLVENARVAAAAAGFPTANYDLEIVAYKSPDGLKQSTGMPARKGIILRNCYDAVSTAISVLQNLGATPAYMTSEAGVYRVSQFLPAVLFDIMGRGDGLEDDVRGFAKYHWLGWIPESEVAAVPSSDIGSLPSSGTYRIQAIDEAVTSGLHLLQIKRTYAETYWLDFRPNADGGTNPWLLNGVCISWVGGARDAELRDMGPYTAQDATMSLDGIRKSRQDAPLVIGRTFTDRSAPAAPIHITPIRKGGTTPESIDVVVNVGDFAGNRAPAVVVGASAATFADGAAVSFAAAASDPDGDA
ncbi:MAG: hypothetical protein AAB215_09725, partial [Planctomycetota bacterium]